MKLLKSLKHAAAMVAHSKLRSWLTIIGIVIGVASVVAIVSIGEGMQQTLNSRISGLGGDILTISPGFSRGGNIFGARGPEGFGGGSQATATQPTLGRADLQVLKGIPEIALIETEVRGSVNVSYLGKSGTVQLTGVDQAVWPQITTSKTSAGRMLDAADQNVVVIGGRLASSYFGKPVGINKMISIGGNAFRVVGILDDQSNQIYMPIQMAYQVLENKENGVYDSFIVKIRNQDLLDDDIAKINARLMMERHVTDNTKDFSVTSSKQMQQTRADIMSSMNAFLLAIAAVSLIVGSIGVANTMFTSVLEKTKEIGIMKAIGARNQDIRIIFILNAALIGLVGGVFGALLGAVLSSFLPIFTGILPLGEGGSTFVSLNSVIMALGVSVSVGIIAGLVPAWQASKLKPVDALRFE